MNMHDPYRTDEQEQLINRNIRAKEVCDRKIDELIGICRGIISDGTTNMQEAQFLLKWIKSNYKVAKFYPFNVLYSRLSEMLQDGILDDEEQKELFETMAALTGGELIIEDREIESMSSTLPLCDPAPIISIKGSSFVFTGVFTTGPRKKLSDLVVEIGGIIHDKVKQDTDFLVIGDIGSRDWAHSSFGRKIEKAVELRDQKKTGIAIVSELHWARYL
jgi:NAD-dependent DNA ligase